jgi:hypothetical protein
MLNLILAVFAVIGLISTLCCVAFVVGGEFGQERRVVRRL